MTSAPSARYAEASSTPDVRSERGEARSNPPPSVSGDAGSATAPTAVPGECSGSDLDLDALVRAGKCVVASAAHMDAPPPRVQLIAGPAAIAGGSVSVQATLVNPTDEFLWVEVEFEGAPGFSAGVALRIKRPPLGEDVMEPPIGALGCGSVFGAQVISPPTLVQVNLAPHGRAVLRGEVLATGYGGGVAVRDECVVPAPLVPGAYEVRASVRLSGDRQVHGSARIAVSH